MSEYVKASEQNGTLVLGLVGRVDSTSAPVAEQEIAQERAAHPDGDIILDAKELEYISSAGLRVVLRLRKAEPSLRVINVSAEVYEVFEMTGFTEMIPIEKAYRQLSVEGCKIIGKGAKGTVYRYDADTIVKVYHDADSLPEIRRERELARTAFVLGIPTAISYDAVMVGDKYGSVFELLEAKSYSQLMAENPANLEKYVNDFADLLRQIHDTPVKQDTLPDIKDLIKVWLDYDAPFLTDEQNARLQAMLDAAPDTHTMIHGDYHSNNVMDQNGEALLIDMDTLSEGHPAFELVNIYFTYTGMPEVDPVGSEAFLGVPVDTCLKVWDLFLPRYLGTKDPARLQAVTDKVKLLCYLRMLRHVNRRGGDPRSLEIVEICKKGIGELLTTVDSFAF